MRVAKLHHGDPIETGITALQRPLMTPIIPKYFCCLLKQHRDALTISFKIIVAIPKFFRNFGLSKILDQKISTNFFTKFWNGRENLLAGEKTPKMAGKKRSIRDKYDDPEITRQLRALRTRDQMLIFLNGSLEPWNSYEKEELLKIENSPTKSVWQFL